MEINVTNLGLNVSDIELRKIFSAYGEVTSAIILRDKMNGRPRGCAIVNMAKEAEGELAVLNLNQKLLDGKRIDVTKIEYSALADKNKRASL